MAQPTPYNRQFNFSNQQSLTPTAPLPADELDGELNAVKVTIDQTLVNLAKIQRDDGALKNGIVTADSLAAALSIGFTLRGAWDDGVNYLRQDGVTFANAFWQAQESHLSVAGQTPTVLEGSTWSKLVDFNDFAPAVIADGSVTTPKLADGALSADATGRAKMADGFVNTAKLLDANVTTAKLADANVTTAKIADSNVTAAKAASGFVVDRAYAEYTTNTNLTALIPSDGTIPQVTEGTQILSVSITPKSTTNRLRVRFQGMGATTAVDSIVVALFVNGAANAVRASYVLVESSGFGRPVAFEYEYVPGALTAQTLTVRVGPSASTLRMNGNTGGSVLGGVIASTIVVEEIKA